MSLVNSFRIAPERTSNGPHPSRVFTAYGLCTTSYGSDANGAFVPINNPTSLLMSGIFIPRRYGHLSTSSCVGTSSVLTGISSLVYKIGSFTALVPHKSHTSSPLTTYVSMVLVCSIVRSRIFVFLPLAFRSSISFVVQNVASLPSSKNA